jgi:hypothetical protein
MLVLVSPAAPLFGSLTAETLIFAFLSLTILNVNAFVLFHWAIAVSVAFFNTGLLILT